ncbi:GNAT family N-acetyltransferase [Kosmotoga pacifica]|uniref:Aminoglycoside adenylyltransferase n=1 Tax=Kosmotoga pacifica TaxID=1330330 RepID=A0A0G2ZFT2_9BACT|nr:GNAT family protein [Kosmotoga pacifica]AKI97653.1 aminoglycoside adenylyltransferase [Kosmotoga pacifica]
MIEIELKMFERNDFERLIGWIESPEFLFQWAGTIFSYPLDELQLEEYIQGAEGVQPIRRIFKAVDINANTVVGHIELNNIDLRNKVARISRVLVGEPSMRGKGVGAQMIRKLLEIGFNQLGLHRIELLVFDFNKAAIRCYEKVGFVKEGLLREARKINDEYQNLYLMSILESEWRAQRLTPNR